MSKNGNASNDRKIAAFGKKIGATADQIKQVEQLVDSGLVSLHAAVTDDPAAIAQLKQEMATPDNSDSQQDAA